MYKRALFIFLLIAHALLANWDDYDGEQIVLFSLAPGTGEHFPKSSQEQVLPKYFQEIARQNPDIKAKIIAIDPRLSLNPKSKEYAFLKGWEHDGVSFTKDNTKIEFYSEYIPLNMDEEYTSRIENYFQKILNNGGILFIGHHAQAYYAFEPFRIVHNKLNIDNVQMYICCADVPPFSSPKVYWNNPCSNDELENFYTMIDPHQDDFIFADGKEASHNLLNTLIQNLKTNFIFYKDMFDLPYKVQRSPNGSLHILNPEPANAAAA